MTIASLTAATAAPTTAPKGSASPVQTATVAPDGQTAAVSSEAPLLSNLEMAVAAARQSAAARQDGLSMLMANLLRATAAGNLPAPVQQAVDQLLALHLPTDVAPDAAAVKTALLTSGLFTEANVASNSGGVPADIKTTLLQLNTAAANWLACAAPSAPTAAPQPATQQTNAAPQPATRQSTAAPQPSAQQTTAPPGQPAAAPSAAVSTPPAIRAEQTVLLAVPPWRDPARRATARTSEIAGSKPAAPPSPQRSTPGRNQTPIEPNVQSDVAPEAETIKSAIRMLGQISQVLKTSGELPKEIKATLVLASKAVAAVPSQPEESQTAVLQPATTPQPTSAPPVLAKVAEPRAASSNPPPPTSTPKPSPVTATPSATPLQTSLPQATPSFAPRGSSPVEQLLALQLAPTSQAAPVSPAPPAEVSPETFPPFAETGVVRAPAPTPLGVPQPDAAPAMPEMAAAVPSSPPEGPSTGLPNDTKTLLMLFANAVETLLPHASGPAMRSTANAQQPGAPPQQPDVLPQRSNVKPQQPDAPPPQPAPADIAAAISTLSNTGLATPGNVPNDLKTLLLLFNMAAEAWLPRATSAAGGTPSVPPPVRGAPSKAQPAALATLPENADPVATAKQLLSGSDAALARQTLLQIASLPDAAPQTRDARWMFDVPLMTPQGAAVAQMIIERDASGTSAEKPTPVWRVQFAIDIEPLGPVRANLALSGDRAWVTISADRPESLGKLQSGVSWLADALQSNALDADIAFQPSLPPQRGATASRFMDHAS